MTIGDVGDKGQRYVVRCKGWTEKNQAEEKDWGYTDLLGSTFDMAEMIHRHPTLHSPRVIDRTTGEDIPLPRREMPQGRLH